MWFWPSPEGSPQACVHHTTGSLGPCSTTTLPPCPSPPALLGNLHPAWVVWLVLGAMGPHGRSCDLVANQPTRIREFSNVVKAQKGQIWPRQTLPRAYPRWILSQEDIKLGLSNRFTTWRQVGGGWASGPLVCPSDRF